MLFKSADKMFEELGFEKTYEDFGTVSYSKLKEDFRRHRIRITLCGIYSFEVVPIGFNEHFPEMKLSYDEAKAAMKKYREVLKRCKRKENKQC